MPILGPNGQPVSPVAVQDVPLVRGRVERTLSRRSAEILRSITLWEMTRRLSPHLICRDCYERHPLWSDRDKHAVDIATTPTGSLLAQCSCSSWLCGEPVPLDTSDIPKDVPLIDLLSVGVKQRPIGAKEFALLVAWQGVMKQHRWFELLSCQDCAKHDLTFCKCAVIPEKSATIDCACTQRRYVSVTK